MSEKKGLPWILYVEPGQRQLEAFGNGLRYNITEVTPSCWGLLVRRMDDPLARHQDTLKSMDEAKAVAETIKPENVTRPQPKGEASGDSA